MNRENVLKSLKINFATSIFAALIAIAAFETGYLTKGVLALNLTANDVYYIEVAAIMLTMVIVPLAIKMFSRAMNKTAGLDSNAFIKLYYKKSLQRMFLLFISLIVDLFIYYGINYDGAMYCAIVSFGALVYSYPNSKVLDSYSNDN